MTPQLDLLASDLPDGLAPREAALSILEQVLRQKKMLDMVLERDEKFKALDPRDRALARMMAATALRRKGQLDDLIARAIDKEAPRPEKLKWILYLGITQILFMDVPNHAAVDTAVKLTAQEGMEGKKAFINAILRRMTNEGRAWLDAQDEAALNIPQWIYRQWMEDYGLVRAKDIAKASLAEAALDITLKDPSTVKTWAARLEAEILSTGSLRRAGGGHVRALDGYEDGAWWIQDASSALPVKLMGDLTGKKVLDLCAAPGGKTMQLAAAGAQVTALDRSAARMAQLAENLRRIGLEDRVQTIIEDGTVWTPRGLFDIVLLDAPCSATGTIRRHPDLLHLKAEKDQAGLMGVQERLLAHAPDLLEAGGMLVYCTCSLQKAEGERQVDKFLAGRPDFKRVPVRREEFGGTDGFVNGAGDVRIFPYLLKEQGGMDGFFISRLRKTA
ncbi:MAG: transcription antitermination factor NusB [Micavibrio sp.]